MKLARHSIAALSVALSLGVSAQTFNDPANLRGERVKARTGLELPVDQGAAGLYQTLLKLHTRASLMMIVAHPDDEDGGMLTYEVRGQGVRAAMLTLNRGEGGQNLMTGDFNDALGLIRTQELLAADRYFGTDQMFGTEVDFGFSKTTAETFMQWSRERVLYDAVRAVRLYRPLVVTSVFIGGPTDGHGHHQVAGETAQEVFNAAGDPKMFPEMGLEPWAPLKVYARAPRASVTKEGIFDTATGQYGPARFFNYVTKTWTDGLPQANVMIHEGDFSGRLGKTYIQFAREGLALQKTQIGQDVRVPSAGTFDVGYSRFASRVAGEAPGEEKSFFDGIDTSLTGIATLAPGKTLPRGALEHIAGLVDQAMKGYSAKEPAKIAPLLAEGLKATRALTQQVAADKDLSPRESADIVHELRVKEAQFELALAQSLGVSLAADADANSVLAGQKFHVALALKNDGPDEVQVASLALQESAGNTRQPQAVDADAAKLAPGGALVRSVESSVRLNVSSRPYFSRKNIAQAFYDVSRPELRNAPGTPPAETLWATLNFAGVPFSVGSVVTQPHSTNPLWVLPELSVSLTPSAGILTPGEKTFSVAARVDRGAGGDASGRIQLQIPAGWQSEPKDATFTVSPANATGMQTFRVTPAAGATAAWLSANAKIGAESFSESFRKLGYPGLPETYFFTAATDRMRAADVHVAPNLKVAYLPGTGDEVQALLENIGVHAATVSVGDIAAGKLSGFNTLIVGVRAYTAHKDLAAANGAILDFAKNGGTVIVQYQAHAFASNLAPYPVQLTGDGITVVEELAKVTLAPSTTGVLDWPNKIGPADFDGWVEERGHGFPTKWDEHYDAPTESHDTNLPPQHGGLLVARYGKGFYAYDAYALYRQLPEAVPGAYRLFANLLSLGHRVAQ